MDRNGELYHPAPDSSDDDEKYNPTQLAGDNVWEPSPSVVAALYTQLEKSGGLLELDWKCPGRLSPQQQKVETLRLPVKKAAPSEDELKTLEKQKLLHAFEEDDFNDKSRAPVTPTVIKTPKANKTPAAQRASFDKIFNRVSAQSKRGAGKQ